MGLKKFEPIAIIGQGCVLPGCFSPEELWQMIVENQVKISTERENTWRVKMEDIIVGPNESSTIDRTWHSLGGYISDFENHFDSNSFELEASQIEQLDPLFKWCFHSAQAALKEAGYLGKDILAKTGLILGNLSYPNRSFSRYYEEQHIMSLFPEWKNPGQGIEAINRFMSGFPAILTSKALGLKGDSFAIDAACASSLYALKLACDKLNSGSEDMMLVGGVCASDPLFLHNGFTALNALSPSGQSRPFNEGADGLIPAEGAGFIVIKRLKDAIKSGDNILGVVRGIGLSNDGKQGGFLSPSQKGQVKSMRNALESSGIKPEELSYIECHATGTSTGDTIEIKSMEEVYASASHIHLSSLKGNIGHAITASGIGSIIKVLSAFKNQVLPPVPNSEPINPSLADSKFSVSGESIPWKSAVNRIAGISNFGFGGNNAHVLIEEWNPKTKYKTSSVKIEKHKVAIIGVEIQSSDFPNSKSYLSHLLGKPLNQEKKQNISFDIKDLSSPPKDLKRALSQQLLLLNTIQNLMKQGFQLGKEETGVFIGMGADTEINRYGFRKRLKDILESGGVAASSYNLEELQSDIGEILDSAGVLGTMPNIPANRINNHFDYCGMGFTLSAEELSGTKALEIAIQAIQNKELDAALVGAVDMSDEFVNAKALKEVFGIDKPLTDAAVVMALKSYDLALKDGDTILATIDPEDKREEVYQIDSDWVYSKMGYSHASAGLIEVATSVLLTRARLQLKEDSNGLKPILESDRGFSYLVHCRSYFGIESSFQIHSEYIQDIQSRTTGEILIHCYSADSKEELLESIRQNTFSEDKKYRLGIVCTSEELDKQQKFAIQLLASKDSLNGWITPNIHYQTERIEGDLAFVYTGAASAYPKMGKALLEEFPGLIGALRSYCKTPAFSGDWIYQDNSLEAKLPFYQLAGSTLICQIHSAFTKNILELKPQAVFGLSSGETNSMFATGVWDDMDGLFHSILDSGLYSEALGGDFNSVKEFWKQSPKSKIDWKNWRILASVSKIKKLIEKEDKAYLTIVNTSNDCVIGGDKEACQRIIEHFDSDKVMPLEHDIAIHCEPVTPFEKIWRKLHTRKVKNQKGIRFYSNYLDGVYTPSSETVADALTGQALKTIDFTRIVEKAWADGIRIFVEHGPRNSLSLAIKDILGDKNFVCVSLDRGGESKQIEALKASAELWAAGVPVNLESLKAKNTVEKKGISIDFPMHLPEIKNKKVLKTSGLNQRENTPNRAPAFAITTRNGNKQSISTPEQILDTKVTTPKAEPHPNLSQSLESNPVNTVAAENGIVELLRNQHAIMSEAHENFLASQLAAQQNFSAFMKNMQDALLENTPENDHYQSNQIEENSIERPSSTLPKFPLNRQDLEVLSSGKISSVFGSSFEYQDTYDYQIRLPQTPYLLCDRVTKIEGEPGSLGKGTIWTELDIRPDSWYLVDGRMPGGILSEASQGFIILSSYLGIDKKSKGEKFLRILGCESTMYRDFPKVGETLKFEIRINDFVEVGASTLLFFEYECYINDTLLISAKNGKAGIFTQEELNTGSGIIWDPIAASYSKNPMPAFKKASKKQSYSESDIQAYLKGDFVSCFGPEFTGTPKRSTATTNYQNLIQNISAFDLAGGPANRGYISSDININPDDWYFKVHFKNDPCMPASVMIDSFVEMIAFYMIGSGLSSGGDGWRIESIQGVNHRINCGGQITPQSKKLSYEVFIDEVITEGTPKVYAHVLATVDGVKALLIERLGIGMVNDLKISEQIDTPLETNQQDLPGPKYSRQDLEVLASGKISSIFGPLFEKQDQYAIQVRMPEPPLLLCDRVTGIDAEPGTLGKGTIWTETDVRQDSWYLHNNRMPPGIFIEAGQADLLLISYLGIDFQNKGDRAYRLLGCELTFYDELPKPGDTLQYDIHVDGYAKSGDTTLFFFHYDCHINGKLRISVRSGQAGFFTVGELEESKGVIWDPTTAEYATNSLTEFEHATSKKAFSPEEIDAYTKGDMITCFGQELAWTQTHTRTPRSQGGFHNFIKNITAFDLKGGPAKHGYLRSETKVDPEDWYFKGHFKNDPCMPGTLMADACLQMMAFYMVGTGLTSFKDGWRFEPVTDEKYKFICRGQVTPSSKKVVYEIFVDEIIDADCPTIYAHVLTTVDGNKAFLCERIGLRLVPDWPLDTMSQLKKEDIAGKKIANYKGFKFGYDSLINCALGKPVYAFGPNFSHYDGLLRSPRLPGPPYHFMTRIAEYNAEPGQYKNNPYVIAEYDIPEDAWYFNENGSQNMPYAVLMEVALQPCGWFSSFVCQYELIGKDLVFRNLDGTATQHRAITPEDQTIITKTVLSSVSIMGEIIIVKFKVVSSIEDEPVFTMDTVFGFFDSGSMKSQKGLPISSEEKGNVELKSNTAIDLTKFPAKYFKKSSACLPSSKLLMIDRISSFYPKGGKHGKGYIKAEKAVDKSEWFFKAHFFQDPVQPGSLGIEAMVQLMQFYMLEKGYHQKFTKPVFEPIAIMDETEWHYRGQVTPDKNLISIDFDLAEMNESEEGISIFGEARLWVDGLKIYHAPKIGMRIREGAKSVSPSVEKIYSKELAKELIIKAKGKELVCDNLPFNTFSKSKSHIEIQDLDSPFLQRLWQKETGIAPDLFGDLQNALIKQFVRAIVFEDYSAIKNLEKKPILYVANHQTAIESILFLSIVRLFNKIKGKAIAKVEHNDTWMGKVARISEEKYQANSPMSILPYNRDKPQDLLAMFNSMGIQIQEEPFSLLVHVDGTRQIHSSDEVKNLGAALIDFAITHKMAIVPVRFSGGLPEKGKERQEFPFELGKQDYHIGKPIDPAELTKLTLKDRKLKVINSINQLVTESEKQKANPDSVFASKVSENQKKYGLKFYQSVFISLIESLENPSEETKKLMAKDMSDEGVKQLYDLIFS